MTDFKELIEEHIHSSAHLTKKHVHPRLMKLFEAGGLASVYERAEGQYLWDLQGEKYLDYLCGGGVFLIGRNHPNVKNAIRQTLDMDIPNLCVTNASILGGLLAEKLLKVAGDGVFSKVFFASTGTETTDMAIRFARFLTRRRRFLYLEGAFHGRTYAAISMCGMPQLREGMEPLLPICTPIKANDLEMLRRELRKGDVAGFIFEPVQGMTLEVMDHGYLREAEILCRQYGTIMIADEVQAGLCRTGPWFATTAAGVRPGILTVSKILSGGQVPVGATLMSEEVYQGLFQKFTSGPVFFSTFAENNLAMAAAISTVDTLEELDAPKRVDYLSGLLRAGLEKLKSEYDIIDRVAGQGMMLGVYFKDSGNLALALQQRLMMSADKGAFGAAVNVDLQVKHRILCQIPGPNLNAIKILPPVITTEEDIQYFLEAFEDTIASYYSIESSPIRSISRGFVNSTMKQVKSALPSAASLSSLLSGGEKKKNDDSELTAASAAPAAPAIELSHARPDNHGIAGHGAHPDDVEGLFDHRHYAGPVTDRADYVVVGSGPGGGLLARSLAASGASVIVVEAGPFVRTHEYSRDIGETLAKYFWEGGLRTMRGTNTMPSLQGRALGGGSVYNSAICMRMPQWMADRWADEHDLHGFGEAEMAPYFDFMEEFLHVSPTPEVVWGPRNLLFKAGAEAMGFDPEPISRSVDGCLGSASCLMGCRNGAKMSTDQRGIPELLAAGGKVYTCVNVDKLTMRGQRATGIVGTVVNPDTGEKTWDVRISAKCVIVAAGAFHTPGILQRSGVSHPELGRNLRCHPGGIMLAKFGDDVQPWTGATQGFHVSRFLQEGIKLESAWTTQSLFASNFRGTGAEFKNQIADFRHLIAWDAWSSGDDSDGQVRALPGGMHDIQFQLGTGDALRLQEGIAKLADMAFAIGAHKVYTAYPEPYAVLYDEDDVRAFRNARFPLSQVTTGSNHIFGSTAMGGNPEKYAVDQHAKVRGTENVYVCDTGIFPSSPGANPMLTLMAYAERMGRELPKMG